MLGAGQDLIYSDTFTGAPSFTTFNPTTNKFTIRGLQKMNNRSFTYDDEFEYYLEDICFNLWGDPFCYNDYLNRPRHKVVEGTSGISLNMECDYLHKLRKK